MGKKKKKIDTRIDRNRIGWNRVRPPHLIQKTGSGMKYLPVDKCQEQQCSRETGILLPDVQRYPSYIGLPTHTCPLNCQCFFGETLVSSDVSTMCWHLPTLAQHIYRDFAYWLSTCMYKVHALNAGLLQDKSFNLMYCYAAKDKC